MGSTPRRSGRTPALPDGEPGPGDGGWTLLQVGMSLMLLAYVWRIQQVFPVLGLLRLTELSSLFTLGLLVADWRRSSTRALQQPVFKLALGVFLLAILSVPGGVWPGNSLRYILEDYGKTFLLMAVIAAGVRTVGDVHRLMVVHVSGALLYSIMSLRWSTPGVRLAGVGGYYDANDLGLVMVCTIPVAVYLLRPGSGLQLRLLALVSLPVLVFVVVQTGSRGGFLGLVAAVLYLVLGFSVLSKGLRSCILVGAAVLLVGAGSTGYWEQMRTILEPEGDYNWAGQSPAGRVEVWKRGVGYMLANPVLGVGVGSFHVAEGESGLAKQLAMRGRGFKWSAAHNSFVQLGAELGVLGLACFVGVLGGGFRRLRSIGRALPRRRGRPPAAAVLGHALAGSLLAFAACGFFLSQAYTAYLWATVGMVVGLTNVVGVERAGAAAGRPG